MTEASKSIFAFSSATLHEAFARRGAMPSAIKPVAHGMRIRGRAFTVASPPQDNLMLHKAIYAAEPGDVLVVGVSGFHEAGYWGEVMSVAAVARRLAGLVIDGCIRDSNEIAALGFPVFARGTCISGTAKHGGGALQVPIVVGDVVVSPGDLIAGDDDGIVVVPPGEAGALAVAAAERMEHEAEIMRRLRSGQTTLALFNLS
ncbi:RraA family protein [bacterium]|nr:MAG: RraA family protein [bacterium]